VRMKQRYASSGRADDGLTADVERGVESSTGQPVIASKAERSAMKSGVSLRVDGLKPRRVVNVGDGGHVRAREVELIDAKQSALSSSDMGRRCDPP